MIKKIINYFLYSLYYLLFFFRFIYCGEVEINENIVVEILYVVDKYCVIEFVKYCYVFLKVNIFESILFVII